MLYKVEELLALRDSVSESAVSIDKFADEDVIKEHVLRPSASASANLACRASNRSLQPSAASVLAPTASQKRPSPSPSIKRGKAEKLLKEHGSPPGLRVTAGGRIVPSDLAPLGTSRYGDIAYKPQPLRVGPGNVMSAQPQSNGNSTARIEVIGGQPVVFVGDRMFALPAVNATNSTIPSGGPTTMDPTAKQVPDLSTLTTHGALPGVPFGPPRASTQTPFAGLDLPTLKAQQALKKQELRTVEQTEVLQAGNHSDVWRASMIEKKRCLIVELDALRKQITAHESDNGTSDQSNSFPGPVGSVTGSTSMPSFASQFQQPPSQSLYAYPAANPYASLMMYQPPAFGAFPSFPAAEPAPFVPASKNPPHSPGSASRRSHAIEIKPPPEEAKRQPTSVLDPKSPTYEPASKSISAQGAVPPTPSPRKRSPWHLQEISGPGEHERRAPSQKPSFSSIDTTDFFPTNTHEHSSTRIAPRGNETKQTSDENTAVPSTPEKNWPASPWNEGHSGHSRNNEPAPTLTSWPEAFGKQPSLSSLRQGAAGQPFSAMLERAPAMGANTSASASSSHVPPRTNSDQRTGTEENWPFLGKAVTHVPSTYQEGYQAGYDHVGIPDSPEVLQGYIQGLLHFLSDESKKRQAESSARDLYLRGIDPRTPSLRGLVAGSRAHDSAISMTFNRNNALSGSQENVRSAKANLAAENSRRDSAYSPQGSVKDAPIQHALHNESVQEPRQRIVSSGKYLNPVGLFPENMVSGHRQVAFLSAENNMDKGTSSRADAFLNGGASRQFSGHQIQNRGYNTPLTMQRFYPTPKELSPGGFGGNNAPHTRLLANHRLSGLDGAMDDLAELINDTCVDDGRPSANRRSVETPIPVEAEEVNASCFKASGGKGKQKATASPAKPTSTGGDSVTSPPTHPSSSPRKSGEHSPAKAKLEQVTNKFRRIKKDDPRAMSPEDRMKRSEKWRQRFQQLKKTEQNEIDDYRKNNPT